MGSRKPHRLLLLLVPAVPALALAIPAGALAHGSSREAILASVQPPSLRPGTSLSEPEGERSIFRQRLSFLDSDVFRISGSGSVREDCEFAATVIRTFSRPEIGFVLDSRCEYAEGLQDYLVRTEVLIERHSDAARKPFRKTTSQVVYRQESSARYAARVLKKLNFRECNVLIDPVRRGKTVALDTIALVGSGRSPSRGKRR